MTEEPGTTSKASHLRLPMMPADWLSRLRTTESANYIIVLTKGNGQEVAPAFQVDGTRSMRRVVQYVNTIAKESGVFDRALDWWTTPHQSLRGRTPMTLLGTSEEGLIENLACTDFGGMDDAELAELDAIIDEINPDGRI